MLTQKQQDLPYIGIFKTAAGEEFIGKIVDETMMSYSVKSPLCMVATQQGFQFAPFIMMADPEKAINVPKPVITAIPAPKLQEQYEQAVSPIQLLKK
jgi:uncharacterized protein (DUF1499 family)